MIHHSITGTKDIAGFSLTAARAGEKVEIVIKGVITSDMNGFFKFIQGIYNIYLRSYVPMEQCNQFLIVRRKDKSADIYINDFQTAIAIKAKKAIKAGEPVKKEDIADIEKVEFPEITIMKSDAIIYCMRLGWKFALYFNFTANPVTSGITELNLDQVYIELGHMYRRFLFENEYNVLANTALYPKLLSDGWFPFIELLGNDYEKLSQLYEYEWVETIDEFLDRFNKKRIEEMVSSWWSKTQFVDKKEIIEAGLSAYLQGDNSGYINCINTLFPQIEGIMGLEYFKENNRKPSFPQLKNYIKSKAKQKFSSKGSLGFPDYFYDYLDKCIFEKFDLITGKRNLARHAVAHGYAKQEDFTRVKALQAILILNQLFFYL